MALAAGDFHCFALRDDGSVVPWCENSYGQWDLPALLHHARYLGSGSYHGVATIAPMLNYANITGGMQFSWAGPYLLEQANAPGGPFTTVAWTSPCTNALLNPAGFFRLRLGD